MGKNIKPGIKIYSFDVFDTVITRAVASPRDIFLVVAEKIRKLDRSPLKRTGKLFYQKRILAEFNARRRAIVEDIKIDDIYRELEKLFDIDSEMSEYLIKLEKDAEMEYASPIASSLGHMDHIREKGFNIVFISDMYLPECFIKELLIKVRAYKEGDEIYVSGDHGIKKSSGKLFYRVINDHGILPEEMCHFGDNVYSDIAVPARMGINIFQTNDSELKRVTRSQGYIRIKHRLARPIRTLLSGFRYGRFQNEE